MVLRDVWDVGGGWFREMENGDLQWGNIFPGEKIPKPDDIYEMLTEDDCAALQPFGVILIAAVIGGLRLLPVLFANGGGGGLNSSFHESDDFVSDPSGCDPDASAEDIEHCSYQLPEGQARTYAQVAAGKPAHQTTPLLVTALGWDSWYWAHGGSYDQQAYQRYALNVYNPDSESAYMQEAALRKSTGLVAFGYGVGRALAIWRAALADVGLDLLDYIPFLECGAEYESSWMNHEGMGDATSPLTDVFMQSAREYARFHGLLAGAIHSGWREARFKASEIASWADLPAASFRPAWMGRALAVGLATEIDLYNRVAVGWSLLDEAEFDADAFEQWQDDNPNAADFLDVQRDTGIAFPRAGSTLSTRDVVHCVGFHWFHWWDRVRDSDDDSEDSDNDSEDAAEAAAPAYQNEDDFVRLTLVPFQLYLLDATSSAGLDLSWSLGNLGFPSSQPQADDVTQESDDASPMYQAGILVRMILTALAYGAHHVLWYSHMAELSAGAARSFANMGVRNDTTSHPSTFLAAEDAYPKASWHALQRLCWLLQVTSKIECVYNRGGLMLIRLTGRGAGFAAPSDAALPYGSAARFRYAFIPWLDKKATVDVSAVRIGIASQGAYARVALVPTDPGGSSGAPEPSGSGYAGPARPVDWGDADVSNLLYFGHAKQLAGVTVDQISVVLWKTMGAPPLLKEPNVGLVAWLTDSEDWDVPYYPPA